MVFLEAFADVPDPRDHTVQHELTEILFVALAAMLCGARHCTEMALFAQTRLELLRRVVPLANGAPSHDTFTRVFKALDPDAFEAAFRRFMAAFGAQARRDRPPGHVAVDGKSLRRAYERGCAHMPPLVVTVFACDTFMSLSQAVAKTGGEAQAAIAALQLLSLKGGMVTADALHCHARFARAVRQAGGHYALALKGNQSKLARDANAALNKAAASVGALVATTTHNGHGRQEVRRALVVPFAQAPGRTALVDLKAVARVEAWRTKDGTTTHKVRSFALSKRLPPSQVLAVVRRHWAIENNLHWQLDVLMAEDQTRTRKNNGPINLAVLRRLALNILQADGEPMPLSHKQLKAKWDNTSLLSLMTYMR
jgi:predicted transposase YbfD/YdcC